MTDIIVDNILISKPRKSDNSYICPIYYENKNDRLIYTFKNACIINVKALQQRNESFVYIKCKHSTDFMYDLNSFIVNVVKDKSVSWFNNNMNNDLIDDYYSNTLVYDKKYGDVIRLKCIGDDDILTVNTLKKVDISVVFNQLRFYKQKFVLECEFQDIVSVNKCDIRDDLSSEDGDDVSFEEDVPLPDFEEIKRIKEECLESTDRCLGILRTEMGILENKISRMEKLKCDLVENNEIDNIIQICDDLEKIRE